MGLDYNMAVAGAGELLLSAWASGASADENKWWSTGKADTEFSQTVEDGGEIKVPGSSWDNMGEVVASNRLPGSLKVTFTIPMFTPRSMAMALSGKMPSRKAVAGGPVVDVPFTFSDSWIKEVAGYGEIDMESTPLVAVDAATGLIDYTDQLVVVTNPGELFIKPAEGATLEDGTELLLDFTELADDGWEIIPNTLPPEFAVACVWMGRNILAGGKKVTHRIWKMSVKPTSAINWQAKEAQSATFECTPIKLPDKPGASKTHWQD